MLNYFRRTLAITFLCASAWAEKTPLTFETANQTTACMEWMLDARFTPEQRQRYQEMLAQMWNQGSRDAISAMARASETLSTFDESKRTQYAPRNSGSLYAF